MTSAGPDVILLCTSSVYGLYGFMLPETPGDRRRRFAKACDLCRGKKARCDGDRPSCARCLQLDTSCHYSDAGKPLRKPRPRSRHVLPDENDPSDTHSATHRARLPNPPPNKGGHEDATVVGNLQQMVTQGTISSEDQANVLVAEDLTAETAVTDLDTVVGERADMRFFGPSSGIAFASLGSTSRRPEQTYQLKQQTAIQSWSAWTHPATQEAIRGHRQRSLPPWSEAFSLASEFFQEEHKAFPCFHAPTFMALLGQQYSGKVTDNPAWWASINAVLALVLRRRVERCQCPPTDEAQVWEYAANAIGAVIDILMRNTQLMSVQALLIVAWFFLGTPNPQPTFMLVGSALRLAHSIGLHKSTFTSSFDVREREMRNKVFWIALSFDRELCLRTGRPMAHGMYDFDADLPIDSVDEDEDESGIMTTVDGSKLNIVIIQARLAIIQGNTFLTLYSTKHPKVPDHVGDSVSKLNQQLAEWCAMFTPDAHPDQTFGLGAHRIIIRLSYLYHNCVIVVNSANSREYWTLFNAHSPVVLSQSSQDSVQRCLSAARAVVSLLSAIPSTWKSLHWDIVSIHTSALILLTINAIRQPTSDATNQDLRAMVKVFELFKSMDEETKNTYLSQTRKMCEELYRKAIRASRLGDSSASLSNQAARGPVSDDTSHGPGLKTSQSSESLEPDGSPDGESQIRGIEAWLESEPRLGDNDLLWFEAELARLNPSLLHWGSDNLPQEPWPPLC